MPLSSLGNSLNTVWEAAAQLSPYFWAPAVLAAGLVWVVWHFRSPLASALAEGWEKLLAYPDLLSMHWRRRKREKKEFERLKRKAKVPEKPSLWSFVTNWKHAWLHHRARKKTVGQLWEMATGGRSFPTTLKMGEGRSEGSNDNQATQEEQTNPSSAETDPQDPDPLVPKGRHVLRESRFKGAREAAKKAMQALKGGLSRDSKNRGTLQSSPMEVAVADSLTDAVVKPPRKSQVQKTDTQVRGYWESNPNASDEVQEAVQVPIVASQIRSLIKHISNAGANIKGAPYIVKRLKKWFDVEMELQTEHERGLDRFITDMTKQILYYGCGVMFRQRTMSSQVRPFKHPVTGEKRPPVWGYAVPDMSTVEAFIDKYGRPRRWRQTPELWAKNKAKEYPQKDVFLCRLPTQNSSLHFWTPTFVLPSLYAVNVLQELHEILERHTESLVDIPYYVSVGHKDFLTGQVTQKMIDETQNAVDTTPRGGTLILPWYADINRVEVEDYLEPLLKTVEFWGQEARRGVGGSDLTTDGNSDSANRNTADQLIERDMLEAGTLVPEIQRAFRFLCWEKIWEWAEKGEFRSEGIKSARGLLSQVEEVDDLAYLVFEEIDMAEQIRRETHALNKFQSGATTHKELREELGHDPESDHADKYFFEIQQEIAEAQEEKKLEGQKELQRAKANPSNQHGTKTKPKRRSNG